MKTLKYPPIYENRHNRHKKSGRNFLGKLLLFAAALILLVALAQFSAFYLLADNTKTLHQADIIIIFPGGKEREQTAWTLAEQGLAPNLIVINSTSNRLKNKAEKYEIDEQLRLLGGGTSRSTFEDVYVAVESIRQHSFNSAILVTSSYHMPRALLLLKMHLLAQGMKVDIQHFPVIAEENKPHSAALGVYYNEMLKIWGSLVEIAGYHLTGKLMNDLPFFQKISEVAHKYLLYKS